MQILAYALTNIKDYLQSHHTVGVGLLILLAIILVILAEMRLSKIASNNKREREIKGFNSKKR